MFGNREAAFVKQRQQQLDVYMRALADTMTGDQQTILLKFVGRSVAVLFCSFGVSDPLLFTSFFTPQQAATSAPRVEKSNVESSQAISEGRRGFSSVESILFLQLTVTRQQRQSTETSSPPRQSIFFDPRNFFSFPSSLHPHQKTENLLMCSKIRLHSLSPTPNLGIKSIGRESAPPTVVLLSPAARDFPSLPFPEQSKF